MQLLCCIIVPVCVFRQATISSVIFCFCECRRVKQCALPADRSWSILTRQRASSYKHYYFLLLCKTQACEAVRIACRQIGVSQHTHTHKSIILHITLLYFYCKLCRRVKQCALPAVRSWSVLHLSPKSCREGVMHHHLVIGLV